ncbi:MAG: peptidyl-prolyl cis-trans isomerase [Desulfuromonadales bacterium]|nr:peptidyl-prolyl cis-trans isomerase [Desulfuromonadales bacterium]
MIRSKNIQYWCARALLLSTLIALLACNRPAGEEGTTTSVSSPATSEPGALILIVNGQTLRNDEFEVAFARTLSTGQTVTAKERAELKRAFLVQMIDRKLTLAEAKRIGLAVTPQEVDLALAEHRADYPEDEFNAAIKSRNLTMDQWRVELQEKLLMEKVLRYAVYDQVAPTAAEQRAYYTEHRDDFNRPAQVRARQIVVAEKEVGQRVLGLLRQGEPFAAVAKTYSLSPDAEQGGDLGYFAAGEMPPEFDQVVFKLQPGRLSELIKTEYGYHVFLVDDKRPAQQLTFEDVRDEIYTTLKMQKEEAAYHQWLQGLRAAAQIEVNWDQL